MNRIIAKIVGRQNGNGATAHSTEARESRAGYIVTRAETAPCTCPDACERDHEND